MGCVWTRHFSLEPCGHDRRHGMREHVYKRSRSEDGEGRGWSSLNRGRDDGAMEIGV